MKQDFSWTVSAKKYLEMYEWTLKKIRGSPPPSYPAMQA
jgi:glycogen synthase